MSQSKKPKKCGAKSKRSGNPCQRYAMDNGRCPMHGGRNVDDKRGDKVPGRPVKHGLYSKYTRGVLAELAEEYAKDKDFISLRQEIALTRALLEKLVSKWEDVPSRDDIRSYFLIADVLRKTNETYAKIEASRKFSLSPEDLSRALRAVVEILKKYIPDEETYEKVREEISKIRV